MRNHMEAGWFYSPKQILQYIPSRVTSLKPPRSTLKDPYTILRQLDRHQWALFAIGFVSWAWDAFDFFTVSLTVSEIAADFDEQPSAVTWGITITLMLRSVGAIISGSISDRYGRKWPMIVNLFLFIVFELCSGFCNTLSQFLGVRALYGLCMGGLLAPAAATALEDLPYDARGILSGLFQQGYAVGYLLAAIFYRALVPTTSHGWRSLFWFGAGPPVLIILWRLYLPETNHFQVMKASREAENGLDGGEGKRPLVSFLKEANHAFRQNWFLFVYMVVLMAGFNSVSHGSQDLYPTFLKDQVGLSATQVTVVTVVGQLGAIVGSTISGWLSSFTGRRLTMMVACVLGGAIVPAYILPRNDSLIASTFCEQVFVGGVWGPIPIHLVELSPPALRALFYGATYQLGNLASSASSTIEAVIGERFPLPPGAGGKKRYDYGKVIGIFLGAVWAYILLFVFVGPEMSQEERDEEALLVLEFEEMRARGVSLQEIGRSRTKEEGGITKQTGKASVERDIEDRKEQAEMHHIDKA
ncbi:hypothetical protein AC578_5169 [Pseudocercospora eumusae]|uniref:Major facilitator superfamily (MFS) profile domain-containing protein n=1 Tax=Pseudocercospora eumusae TaxID=321146 RepID=A0A139HMI0_9PEZI|nr:hypothetical protein AC578_5169 [Pseudocercospora eumusae]